MYEISIKFKITFVSLLVFLSPITSAEIYKWTDENGDTHYSQIPPNTDVNVETVKPPPSVDTDAAVKNLKTRQEVADGLRENRLTAKDEKAKAKAEKEQKKQQCQQLNERLKTLINRPRANKQDESGNLVRMTEEERQKDINDTKAEISEKCN